MCRILHDHIEIASYSIKIRPYLSVHIFQIKLGDEDIQRADRADPGTIQKNLDARNELFSICFCFSLTSSYS